SILVACQCPRRCRIIAAEVITIEEPPIYQEAVSLQADMPFMQVPVGHVVAGITLDRDVAPDAWRQVNPALIEIHPVFKRLAAARIKSPLPPVQERSRLLAIR